jgi:hypothetical protein
LASALDVVHKLDGRRGRQVRRQPLGNAGHLHQSIAQDALQPCIAPHSAGLRGVLQPLPHNVRTHRLQGWRLALQPKMHSVQY